MKKALAAVVVLAAATGCSAPGDRSAAAAETAVRMLTAVRDRDGTAACELLAPKTVSGLRNGSGEDCAAAILDRDLPDPGTVTERRVFGQWAQVRLGGDTVFLAVLPGGWRWSRPGARRAVPDRTTAPSREAEPVRVLFVLLLVVIAAGLVYLTALGVLHR